MAPRYEVKTWSQLALAIVLTVTDVLHTWICNFIAWSRRKPVKEEMLERLASATDYDEWLKAAQALDLLPAAHSWRLNPVDSQYDFRLIDERRRKLYALRKTDDIPELTSYLRHGLFRNMYGITKLGLYDKTYSCTKESIHMCLDVTVDSIHSIADSATAETRQEGRLSAQEWIDNIHDAKQTFGQTALMLQGGSIFGLCHLGVVKALLHEDCLPRVIVGTATGALMAALVGIHTREDLPKFLSGERIDLSAFAASSLEAKKRNAEELDLVGREAPSSILPDWFTILGRRLQRLAAEGFLLDPDVLNECVEANVGDVTFEEAYNRTGCILNIVVSPPTDEIPSLMNYLTAPNVLIRSAAMISHNTNMDPEKRRSRVHLLSKNAKGTIESRPIYLPAQPSISYEQPNESEHPTRRLRQQFNVEHFIISQARPYLAPFVRPSLPYVRGTSRSWIPYILSGLLKHSLQLADTFNLLPSNISRILSDEKIQGDKFTLVPELSVTDWTRLLKNPSKEEMDFWILKGERCVWPSLCALKARMAVEMALDYAWTEVELKKSGKPSSSKRNPVDKQSLVALPPQPVYRADEDGDWQSRKRKTSADQNA
ncbi:unnamed protein product [Cercospora beticola]|nr:unnamed protein product [Cercospora beticola]